MKNGIKSLISVVVLSAVSAAVTTYVSTKVKDRLRLKSH